MIYLSAEELEDLAYKIIISTEQEKTLIEESLTEWQLFEVNRYKEEILEKMQKWQ